MMDQLPPNARAFLEAVANSDDPTAAERARADAALRDVLRQRGLRELPALPAAHGSSVGLGESSALALKLGLLGLSILGAATLAVFISRPAAPSAQPAPAPARVIEQPARTAPAPERSNADEAAPLSAPKPTPRIAPRARTRNAPATRASAPARPLTNDDALQRELRAVASANELLHQGRFADTLRVLDAIEHETTTHVLREERSALRILAECAREPDEHAVRESERFLRSSPQAVLAARVREACTPKHGERP
jgi:hypothetical protein